MRPANSMRDFRLGLIGHDIDPPACETGLILPCRASHVPILDRTEIADDETGKCAEDLYNIGKGVRSAIKSGETWLRTASDLSRVP